MLWAPMYKKDTRLDGKVVVITGSNTGIGIETARDMFKRGARVIMGVRNTTKGDDARTDIKKASSGGGCGSIEVLYLDLQSIQSIRNFARRVNTLVSKLHLLINNAGVMACPRFETEDGFEGQLGVNHLGHFLLTHLLLDKLKAAAPSRIVNLTSGAHTFGKMTFDNLMLKDGAYSPWGSYGQSKLANILFTRELARRVRAHGITVYAVHPGMVNTELWRHLDWVSFVKFKIMLYLWYKNPVQGAQTTLYCALDPDLSQTSGRYYADCAEQLPSEAAQNDQDAKKLWNVSCKLMGVPCT